MKVKDIISDLEKWAPPYLQESYDNSGLIVGREDWNTDGVIVALDCTEEVIDEAIEKDISLIVMHHPIVFNGLKRFNGSTYVERVVMKAIKNDIAIYAIHTNLDNVHWGVNAKIIELLGLGKHKILNPMKNSLKKFQVYVPSTHVESVELAVFSAGGGRISSYEECSFKSNGIGSFKGGKGTNPVIGKVGKREFVEEMKLEFIVPVFMVKDVESAARTAHPYEEMAFEWLAIENNATLYGAGAVGELKEPLEFKVFLDRIKTIFGTTLKYTAPPRDTVQRIAVCGGSGSFLLDAAKAVDADIFITSDYKYHQFFDADGTISILDIGHFESEQFTIDLIADRLSEKFPKFAVLKTAVNTNPIQYY